MRCFSYLIIVFSGKVYCLGRKEYGRLGIGNTEEDAKVPTLIPVLENEKCVEVAAGEAVSFAVTESGTSATLLCICLVLHCFFFFIHLFILFFVCAFLEQGSPIPGEWVPTGSLVWATKMMYTSPSRS